MQTSVTFKNLPSSENLKNYVTEKLDRFDRLLDNPAEASVVLSVEKFRHIAEINIVGDRLNIIGKEEINDMYSAIDMVLDKLEKQIKKSKQKNRERRSGAKSYGKVSYEELKSGTIEFNGRKVSTVPLSSVSRAREIAEILKNKISRGKFYVGEPVFTLPQPNI